MDLTVQPVPIQFLSHEVRSQLRSGIATPSVVQCVEELVVNSIDAGAACVAVRVDLPNCKFQVIDNGRGITHEDMSVIGERYATSKCRDVTDLENISYYGYRGEALASIKEISSVLEICSRARGSKVTYSKIFHHGKEKGISEDSKLRPSGGTTVMAHNVFYNMPVRRKMLCCPLVYEQVYKRLQAISLIHPNISLTLRDDSTGAKSIQTHSSLSIAQTFGHLFGRELAESLREVSHIHGHFNMTGFIGITSYRNKSLQFLYVNGRLVLKTKLHKLVNELLGRSLIMKTKGKYQESVQENNRELNPSNCQPSPGRNNSDYGIFVINITCPRSEYDITLDPAKTLVEFKNWDDALACMSELVSTFLHRENLTMKLSPAQQVPLGCGSGVDSFAQSNNEAIDTETGRSDISTSNCRNTVHSTCVRRQATVQAGGSLPTKDSLEALPSQTVSCNDNYKVTAIVEANESHTSHRATGMSSGVIPKNGTLLSLERAEPSSLQHNLTTQNGMAEINSSRCTPDDAQDTRNSTVEAQPALLCGEVLSSVSSESPVLSNKQECANPDKNIQVAVEDTASCEEAGRKHLGETLVTSTSSGLDMSSGEETLSSSEIEMESPSLDTGQNCAGPCAPLSRTDHNNSIYKHNIVGQGCRGIDCTSMRDKLSVKAQNSLSMFRRSVGKERLEKSVPVNNNSVQKSIREQYQLPQITTAREHKTIALRWHRSPGFRSRLASLGIQCQERQEPVVSGVFLEKVPRGSEKDITNDDHSAQFMLASVGDNNGVACEASEVSRRIGKTELESLQAAKRASTLEDNTEHFARGTREGNCEASSRHTRDRNCTVDLERNQKSTLSLAGGQVEHQRQQRVGTVCASLEVSHVDVLTRYGEGQCTDCLQTVTDSCTVSESVCGNKRRASSSLLPAVEHKKKNVSGVSNETANSVHINPCVVQREFFTTDSFLESSHDVFCCDHSKRFPGNSSSCLQKVGHHKPESTSRTTNGAAEEVFLANIQNPQEIVPPTYTFQETEPFSIDIDETSFEGEREMCNVAHLCHDSQDHQVDVLLKAQTMQAASRTLCHSAIQQFPGQTADVGEGHDRLNNFSSNVNKHQHRLTNWNGGSQRVSALPESRMVQKSSRTLDNAAMIQPSRHAVKAAELQGRVEASSSNTHASRPQHSSTDRNYECHDGSTTLPARKSCWVRNGGNESEYCSRESIVVGKIGSCTQTQNMQEPLETAEKVEKDSESMQHYDFKELSSLGSSEGDSCGTNPWTCNINKENMSTLPGYANAQPRNAHQSKIVQESSKASCEASDTRTYHGDNTNGGDSCLSSEVASDLCGIALQNVTLQKSSKASCEASDNRMCHVDKAPDRSSACSHHQQDEDMDTTLPFPSGDQNPEFVIESREWYSVFDASRGRKVFINRTNGNCTVEEPNQDVLRTDEGNRQTTSDIGFTMVTKSDSLAHPHLPSSAALFVSSLKKDRKGAADAASISISECPPMTPAAMATLDAVVEDHQMDDDELANIKWGGKSQHTGGSGDHSEEAPSLQSYGRGEIGPAFKTATISDRTAGVDAKFQAKVLASLNPCQFTKSMFENIQVLGQVDDKFIACLVNSEQDRNPAGEPNLLVLVDQHAAHERIRLEMLMAEAYGRNNNSDSDDKVSGLQCLLKSNITPPVTVNLSVSELRLMKGFQHKFARLGIDYDLTEDQACVRVNRLPACVAEREANELKRGRQTVANGIAETLIKEVLDLLQRHSGAVSGLPKTVIRILNSQACHGAIKFGDALELDECRTLIGQLSSCDLPFQCAHGRPALMPILDLRKMKSSNSKEVPQPSLQLWKLRHPSTTSTS